MANALYYPFSRCLDDVALKRAVLLYDEILFVDPVEPAARTNLYLREGIHAGADPRISERWGAAEQDYQLLHQHGIVRTVDHTAVRDPQAADALAAGGLRLDVETNGTPSTLFAGRHRWQMLEDRIPPSALSGRYRPRPGPSTWGGERVVELPYAVGASVALTYALVIAHELGVALITEQRRHSELLAWRLRSAALLPDGMPGLYAAAQRPYLRQQVEVRVAGMLAPATDLRRLSMQDVLDYRAAHEPARQQLTSLLGQLADEAHSRPWDVALEAELDAIATKTREIANGLPGASAGVSTFKASLSKPSLGLDLAWRTGLTAYFAPNLPLLAALGAGAMLLGGAAKDAALAGYDELRRARTPEENAVAYLLDVR